MRKIRLSERVKHATPIRNEIYHLLHRLDLSFGIDYRLRSASPVAKVIASAPQTMRHLVMKLISEKQALENLRRLKTGFAQRVRIVYEHRAKSCATCETQGACCLDAHFVNIHITRLEAAAIRKVIEGFSDEKQAEIYNRIDETISKFGLTASGDTFAKTYACPLFEKETGCLVHSEGKPLPCIQHLPPDELLAEQEGLVERLNKNTYAEPAKWLPLPLFIRR